MRFNALIPELTVSDIEKTKAFYLEILGFTLEYERPENLFVFLSLEENQMMFQQDSGTWETGPLEYPYGRGVNFEMTVSDVNTLYRKVLMAGVEPFRELTQHIYRNGEENIVQNEFLIQDPDGYLLRFTD